MFTQPFQAKQDLTLGLMKQWASGQEKTIFDHFDEKGDATPNKSITE